MGLSAGPRKRSGLSGLGDRLVHACEVIIISAAVTLVIVAIILATIILYALFIEYISSGSFKSIDSTSELQEHVQHIFAGVLLLLLGLELLKSVTSFFLGYRLQLEMIVVVSIIAVARHIMLVDVAHAQALNLLGSAALILALAISYALVRHSHSKSDRPSDQ
jgi:uncharacterized membrane protein (DUF373 family)